MFLRGMGFVFHRFAPLVSRTVRPMIASNNIYGGWSQTLWADAIFIKDFRKFDQLSFLQLKKIALILHDAYGSFDIVLRALMALDIKSKSNFAEEYMLAMS